MFNDLWHLYRFTRTDKRCFPAWGRLCSVIKQNELHYRISPLSITNSPGIRVCTRRPALLCSPLDEKNPAASANNRAVWPVIRHRLKAKLQSQWQQTTRTHSSTAVRNRSLKSWNNSEIKHFTSNVCHICQKLPFWTKSSQILNKFGLKEWINVHYII